MIQRKKKTAKKPVAKQTRRRDKVVIGTGPTCPRCGEAVSIELDRSFYGGKKYYRCWSEECKGNNVNKGMGRRFLVMPDGRNVNEFRKK